MIRLTLTELRRYSRRWLFLLGFAGIIVLQCLVLANFFASTAPPSADALAQAQQWADENNAWADQYFGPGGDCERERDAAGGTEEEFGCLNAPEPATALDMLGRSTYESAGPDALMFMGIYLVLYGAAVGVSFITAEATTGAITNWLTFEPRRIRVFLSKVLALTLAIAATGAAYLGLGVTGIRTIASYNDAIGPNSHQTDPLMAESAGRWLLLVVLAALIGFALGALVRHAAIALGALALTFIVDSIVTFSVDGAWRFTVFPRLYALTQGKFEYADIGACTSGTAGQECFQYVWAGESAVYLAILTAVAVAISAAVFRRRDVV